MQIVWQSGETPIKKRAASACTSCRSRKKKCYHVGRRNIERVERTGRRIQQERPSTTARKTSPSPGRVSEYNPESILAALSEDAEPGPSTQILEANTTALHPTPSATTPSLSTTYEAQRRLAWYKKHKTRAAPPPLSDAHRRYLEDEGAFLILPKTTTDALLPLYISTLDDLTPITHGTSIFRSHSNNQASAYLVRAICLVVCKTTHATPFLRLTDPGPLLEPLDFASRLLAGLDAVIKADLEPDRVTKMQILALMHLHNDGLAGVDRASSHLSQAICEAWSLGIHLKIPDSPDKERCEYLWWSLRNFDRLGKPIMAAAPFFIDDADVGIERIVPEKGNYRSQIMAVALGLGDLMTVATKAYKAGARAAVDSCAVFPQLEDVVRDVDFEGFHRAHRRMISFLSISHIVALASLSATLAVLDAFFFLCRSRSKMKIPIKANAAIPPTTTPAMSPVDGPELDFDEDAGFATAVDELNLCVVFGVLSEDDANPVAAELVTTVLLLDAVTSAAILVASTDPPVGNAPSTLPATLSITAVGTVTPLLDNTDDTSPTILDIKLPICLRCCSWTRH
ncbi:Fungal-trans multi-domain protein [Pyrenophora tritici-repentis]|nr:Fungal-trans multi-domain protein [Pyrenophora tritici-repentis]KAI1538737.1 Fungal-trans multi-domain protein [Pyrenophora tritici-repentis]KAI1550636.1 Fungal-trans multi-domain protein [Pyrenophora tritici-repentis]KAI1570575.1 Fungal-trans multi-domain protein [Pyrenophora tritici-repentis]KAI1577734.1 Fungal-trans multi-domain protein [Pyrenophora tritici-repentis]